MKYIQGPFEVQQFGPKIRAYCMDCKAVGWRPSEFAIDRWMETHELEHTRARGGSTLLPDPLPSPVPAADDDVPPF